MEFYIAQGISVFTGVLAVYMMQLKKMKAILFLQVVVNFLASLNYLLLGGDSGMVVSLLAILQSVVMFFYSSKGRKPHLWVVIAFIACYVVTSAYNVIATQDALELLPALAAVCFSISLVQENPSRYRIWGVINISLWLPYDLLTTAYVMGCVHLGMVISGIAGIIRLDLPSRKKKEAETVHTP